MTSHELRNPLSAVVQSADSVIASLQGLPLHDANTPVGDIDFRKTREEIVTSIDSLQTIVSCSLHQKRVIDDVLTLSKLDSNLILITPVRVQSAVVVSEALKMFDVECSQMDIKLEFRRDPTSEGYDWIMLDPSRLLQVLINLLYVFVASVKSPTDGLQNQCYQIHQRSAGPQNNGHTRSIAHTTSQSMGLRNVHPLRRASTEFDQWARVGRRRASLSLAQSARYWLWHDIRRAEKAVLTVYPGHSSHTCQVWGFWARPFHLQVSCNASGRCHWRIL